MRCLPILAAAAALAACSSGTDQPAAAPSPTSESPAAPSPNVAPSPATAAARVIGLEGLGDLRIGQPVPAGSGWREAAGQTGPACRTVSSPAYPGAYAIVADGKVRRITIGRRSDVQLAEGIGVGASEADVRKWFAGFRAEPHKYQEAPAKYLTAPNAASGEPALRFEIGADDRVAMIHVGTMPVLGYVEGCA